MRNKQFVHASELDKKCFRNLLKSKPPRNEKKERKNWYRARQKLFDFIKKMGFFRDAIKEIAKTLSEK